MKVIAISGSRRRDSHNTRLLRAAAEAAPEGVEVELWEGLREVPPFDEDAEGAEPEGVASLRAALRTADALLIATPEYNHSIPGALKNAIDWASRPYATSPLRNLPTAVISSSTGMFGAVWAQAELAKVMAACGARVVEPSLSLPRAGDAFDDDGQLREEETRAGLRAILDALEREAMPASVVA
jgi:chromate reductase